MFFTTRFLIYLKNFACNNIFREYESFAFAKEGIFSFEM